MIPPFGPADVAGPTCGLISFLKGALMRSSNIALVVLCSVWIASCSTGTDSPLEDLLEDQYGYQDVSLETLDSTIADVLLEDRQTDNLTCISSCAPEGASECFGNGWRSCVDPDDDGCFDWGDTTPCGSGTVCQDGECVVACPEQPCTVVGTHKCGDDNEILECGDYDADGCLEWGNPMSCAEGLVCAGGFCSTSCSNECTIVGAAKCEGNSVVTCGDYSSDGCLEWGDDAPCGTLTCSSGYCQTECSNECTQINSQQCEGIGYKICGNTDADSCLEWGSVINCGMDQTCSNGFCQDVCQNECSAIGARKCEGNAVAICNDYNSDLCLEWGTPLNCATGLTCSNGNCVNECEDECTVALAKSCDEGGNIVVCNDYNQDSCLEWGSPTPCQQPYLCSLGNCVATCQDECSIVNEKTCVDGATNLYEICGNWDSDDCLEWGSSIQCPDTLVCSNGNCALSCENECVVVNATRCVDGIDATATCGDYNDDTCLEWGTPLYCEAWQSCSQGVCVQALPPADIVINELLYDSEGSDTNVFVEIKGPAGTSLEGFFIVGVNGATGADYQAVALTGSVAASGFFVVAHTQADSTIAEQAGQFSDEVNFENGPDSVQLRFGETVVDAVGYGTFPEGTFFGGEGEPAVDVVAGHSLGRDSQGTDTNDNATDFSEFAMSSPGSANQHVNQLPSAALVCPQSGTTGQALDFDGSGSSDPDGTLTAYLFEFDDGDQQDSAQATASHLYESPGNYTVSLTVTDDNGATDTTSCELSIGDSLVPEVQIIKPLDNKQVTQGFVVSVLVDANATPGRSISGVVLLADGVAQGAPDTQAPYEFSYVVPMGQPTNSTIALQAKATDNANSTGYSALANLQVLNDAPIPSFTAVVSGTLAVSMDASACFDTETAAADLEVRWDFTNDNVWDTDWSTTKLAQHTYPSDGTYTIKMAVKDAAGQMATTTRSVTLSSIQYVSGNVTTTTWTGTIVITGDVTVPAGNVLTISSGTSVLFSWNDQGGDSIGDWGISVLGTLLVNGTQEKPVIFTSLGTSHKSPDAWDRMTLQGTGHNIQWAIFEYANAALDLRGSGEISDSTIRFSTRGVEVRSPSNFTFHRCTVSSNELEGVYQLSGTATVNHSSIVSNGGSGVYVQGGGVFNLYDSTVEGNQASGLHFYASGTGSIQRNLITGNALEGVRIETNGSSDPNPVIQYNNLFGNALLSARVVEDILLTAYQSVYGTVTSDPWSTPGGEFIEQFYWAYSESDSSSNYYSAAVLGDQDGTTVLQSIPSTSAAWKSLSESQAISTLRVRVQSTTTYSYYGGIVVSKVAYNLPGAIREMSVITSSQRIDARHNYFGVFPDVLDVITVGPANRVNVEGFVGVPFDDSWSKGIYYGGEAITQETLWLSDVIITGALDVTSTTLTIGPGVNVRFGCVDADGNGVGDCDIESANSTLLVQGTALEPVVFTDYHTNATPSSWSKVSAYGSSGVNLNYAVFEYAQTGLELKSGLHTLDHVTTRNNATHGLTIVSASGVTANGLVSKDNAQDGVNINSSSNLSFNKAPGQTLLLQDNGRHGLYVSSSTTGLSLSNASVTGNQDSGLLLRSSSMAVDHSTISQNQYGLRYLGSSAGTVSACNIKYNQREGIFLATESSTSPNPGIHGNNIYGNSVLEAGAYEDPGLTATLSVYGTSTAGPYTAPGNAPIAYIRYQYSESDSSSNYYSGGVYEDAGFSKNLAFSSSSVGPLLKDIQNEQTSTLYVRVQSTTTYSYSGTMTVTGVFYYKDSSSGFVKELAAITDSGSVSCTDNYWGLGLEDLSDIPNRLTLARTTAVDYSGYVGTEKSGTGPQ